MAQHLYSAGPLLRSTSMAQHPATVFFREPPVVDGEFAVHDDVGEAFGEGEGLGEGGGVLNAGGVEDEHIGGHAGGDAAAVIEPQGVGGEGTHATNGAFKGEDLVLADILGEDAGEGAEGAGMGAGGG